MIEIYTGKSMLGKTTKAKKVTPEEIEEAFEFIYEHVKALYIPPEERTIDNIMSQVTDEYDGFVLDPWNEIEHSRDPSLTETEYIGQTLMKLKANAVWKDMHIWVVAHPKKLVKENGDYKPPTPYDISGSANWYNKADMAVTTHRKDFEVALTEIYVNKVKVRGTGNIGKCVLDFDRDTQRFFEPLTEF
jgi:twinkle protein